MFRLMPEAAPALRLSFQFDGRAMTARAGDTVAAALLANGVVACRETPVSGAARGPFSGAARGPYCMMGICFECLVVIDGVGNRQGCLVPLTEGMQIETQHGRRQAEGIAP